MANIDISSFFSAGNSSSGMTSMLSDYSAIKNGSYKKLLKANYDAQKEASLAAAGKAKTNDVLDKILDSKKNPKVSAEASAANSALTSGISSLSSSISSLQKDATYEDSQDGATAKEKTSSAVKSFVENYNSVVKNAKESTLNNVTSNVASMMKTTQDNADKLKEIGINVQDDGTLVLDEKKLAQADLNKVHEVFDKDEVMSYGSTVGSRLKFASYGSGSTVGTSASDTVATKNETNTAAESFKDAALALASKELYEPETDDDGQVIGQFNVNAITAKAKDFVNSFNSMYNAAKFSTNSGVSSNLNYMVSRLTENTAKLSKMGITMNNNNTLSFNETLFRSADMTAARDFFSDFGSGMATNASLVNHYMTTQAGAASGYTAEALYNVTQDPVYQSTM